jgi:hypothetical protein
MNFMTSSAASGQANSSRAFANPVEARRRVAADLAAARRRFRDLGITDVEVEGSMRLPMWFTVGTALSSTAGFTVAAQSRDGLWASTVSPGAQRDLEVLLPAEAGGTLQGSPWAVSVSFACDIAPDVDKFIAKSHLEACHIKVRLPAPGHSAIHGAPHARALIYQLREELRTLASEHEPTEILLFPSMPHACALLLGNAWDRMPTTTVFWDMGRTGSYEPALRVN